MCNVYYRRRPDCGCVHITGSAILCQLSTSGSESEIREFRPKLATSHCRGLKLLFDNVVFVSCDIEKDAVPTEVPECPNVKLVEQAVQPGSCPLCDSLAVLRYLKIKNIEYPYVADQATHDPQDREIQGVAETADRKVAGKSEEGSVGELVDKPVGRSSGKWGLVAGVGRAMEVVKRAKIRPGVERRSPAEPTPESMGWD